MAWYYCVLCWMIPFTDAHKKNDPELHHGEI